MDRDALAARFDVSERYLLAVATREPRKNLGALLRAFERLASLVDDVDFVLVGGRGWRSADLERTLAAVGDRVKITGFVSDEELAELYAGAAAFAFPSFAEGFGLPVLEAMASGVPVVTSDRTSLPEVAGDAALLVDPDDDAGLVDALERLLTDGELAADLARRGLARSAQFTWEACARATRAAYPTPEWTPCSTSRNSFLSSLMQERLASAGLLRTPDFYRLRPSGRGPILDVGCGNAKYPGAFGLDISPDTQADLVCDLNEHPYALEESSFDQILCQDVIEHVPRAAEVRL